jgi:hypothetical protein
MSEPTNEANISSDSKPSTDSNLSFDSFTSLFSNKNLIIIVLLLLLIFALIGINLLALSGKLLADITGPIVPAFQDLLSMIGFTVGNIINGGADVVANTSNTGIDIAKGTTHSIGDLLIQSTTNSGGAAGVDLSKQFSISEVIGVSSNLNGVKPQPQPIQSTEPTVTSISTQKPKAGWCYVGDFSGARGCVEVTEHDKCMSGQIFANQAECLRPTK